MIVEQLGRAALGRLLRGPGLALRTGPVVTRVRTSIGDVADGIALHYARHPVEPAESFVDFHVSVRRPRGLRRWVQPQVVFGFDDEVPFAPLPGDQGFAMLEWGLNWCVSSYCHQYLIVHAAVVERAGRAIVMPAPSGSGKSTLCAGLVYGGGWRLMSDELALLVPATGRLTALPRPVSLKNASIDAMRRHAPTGAFGRVVSETVKGRVVHVQPPHSALQRAAEDAVPTWVIVPRYAPGEPARLTPLSRARAFMTLVDNAFNYQVHGRAGFASFAALVDGAHCHEFRYGDLDEAIALFDRLATA